MAKNVLIATLGESPIVVTSMVKALEAKKKISIDLLYVIHPEDEKLIDLGYDMIIEHFKDQCCVTQRILPFPDTNSYETSMAFLQILSGLIESHEKDNVYLSLAGGRKNMSALMAVTCQFFECVRGLYHILDKHEDNPNTRNFHFIEELCDFEKAKRKEKLSPPAEDLILVEIPYPRLSNGIALRKYFSETQTDPNVPTPVEIEGELDAFYREIFQKEKTELLDIYLSEEAYERYPIAVSGDKSKLLKNCFRSMRNPQTLKKHIHSLPNAKTDCKCFKMGNTDERIFYYQIDSSVVTATIVQHDNEYKRIANGKKSLWSQCHPAFIHSSELKEDSILIAPLGKSPMVVTQTFTLLSKRERANIKKVVVVHPKNADIRNGVGLLKDAFKEKQNLKSNEIPNFFQSIEIRDIIDITSQADCETYLKELVSVIEKQQADNPDKSIYLSLSGGRKGMTALTLFAAQQANIDAVYHTLITDIALEKKIEEETTLTELQGLTRFEKVQRLFLDDYCESKFELFRVPVIPLQLTEGSS